MDTETKPKEEVTGNMVQATDDYEPRINKSIMDARDAAGSVQRVETPPWEGDYCEPGGLTLRLGCCNTLQLRTLKSRKKSCHLFLCSLLVLKMMSHTSNFVIVQTQEQRECGARETNGSHNLFRMTKKR